MAKHKGTENDKGKMKRKLYEKEPHKLQVELCHLQEWVKAKGPKIIIMFEGRDAAGKGGTIKALTERVSPRVFRVVTLRRLRTAKRQRCLASVTSSISPLRAKSLSSTAVGTTAPASSALWDVDEQESDRFLRLCPVVEKQIVDSGIILIKIWLEASMKEQENRFVARIEDPLRQWKLSPMDVESYSRWYDYSRARIKFLRPPTVSTRLGTLFAPKTSAAADSIVSHTS